MPPKKTPKQPPSQSLLASPLRVVNVGLAEFAENLRQGGVPVIEVEWSPPEPVDPKLTSLLSKLGT
ncbi:MAG: hypothetical protein O7A08_12820 [SAR324 cluster bacterium]|nr:hypothetical protein [SAR324 cluster bacterium]MCZ6533831.1 hypothetical protein [SAR324 cluster bacterium]